MICIESALSREVMVQKSKDPSGVWDGLWVLNKK